MNSSDSADLHETDVLIIGCGIAGCTSALALADAGFSVTVVTRSKAPEESNTRWAQGGIIYEGVEDSHKLLEEDILRAGAGHCYPPAVKILAEQGPDSVRRVLLDRVGVKFDAAPSGDLSLAREGGHTISRIIHAADATGHSIQVSMIRALSAHPQIRLLTSTTAIDLLTPAHHSLDRQSVYQPLSCVGAYLFSNTTDFVTRCVAKKTILATGGLGQIFLQSTNPVGARGDGIAMAYRAGVDIINAEFVQFHPTAFYARQKAHFLVSEAVRGAGARLVDASGEPFMQKYDEEWLDLAPRDVVARSIHREMLANGVTNVYLDLRSHISQKEIREHFPNIRNSALEFGVDIENDLVPVVPAAHYFCGGIRVDEWGRTNLQDLYAIGEVSCTGVHGANRLASTSLLEGLVWGERAAEHIQDEISSRSIADDKIQATIQPWQYSGIRDADPALIAQDMSTIKHVMWNYVGLVRTKPRLERALRELRQLEIEIEQFYRKACLSEELIGLRNSVRTALIVADAAWQNKQSIGCHYRE